MMSQANKISVSEALKKAKLGEDLSSTLVDFDHIKVEALNALQLSKAGVVVPDSAIYYDDDSIEIDEAELGGNWTRIDYDPVEVEGSKKEVNVRIKDNIYQWIETKNISVEELIDELLTNFYNSNRLLEK